VLEKLSTQCCIVGGGPAGVMLGFLLARQGVDVIVLEKHKDFLRDFRGDTIHPSTLELMYELGILDEFLKLPHQEIRDLSGRVGKEELPIADFTHLPTRCKFVAFMPQWDFLNFIAGKASRYSCFQLRQQSEATDLIRNNRTVVGVSGKTPEGTLEIRAPLTVGADGRHSVVRQRAGLKVITLGAPMDVFWMRLSRKPTDPGQTFGHLDAGRIFIMLNRETYWQCGFVIPKGAAQKIRDRGLPALRKEIADLSPFLEDRVDQLQDWDQLSLLTVAVDRLARWTLPGLLCIGDAAHAMSPIGGVGINLAIQDAVAASNLLGPKLLRRSLNESDLQLVQERRMLPTRATQWFQVTAQNRVIQPTLSSTKPILLPWQAKLFRSMPFLRRITARMIGMGFRPEHIRTQETQPQ
jgi:2-polyprenyl-6-methoxyphenol hydroxylase-like FAD-dependent oxidoreductase